MSEPQPPLAIDWTAQRAVLGRHYFVWQLNLYALLAVLFVAFIGFSFSSPFLPFLVRHLVHLHRSFYAIEAPVIYLGYETTTLYPTLD